jgi:hypothetical protein
LRGSAGFQYIGLDNVSVVGLGGDNPIPEPATYALMGLGLSALMMARWRKP